MKSKTKTTYIGFKCAPEQKEQIISKCRKYGLSMSEFIRVSCVRSSINIISGIPELTIELSRIGKILTRSCEPSICIRNLWKQVSLPGSPMIWTQSKILSQN